MKIALVSDIHIHPWQEHSYTLPNGLSSRLADCVHVLRDILRHCLDHDIRVMVMGGDLFHKRGVVYTQAYNLTVEVLADFHKHGISVLMVDGNHDHANKAGTIHAVQALASAGLVNSVIPETGWTNWILEDGRDILTVCGFSYCDDREAFTLRLEQSFKYHDKMNRETPVIAVCHHGFKGARIGTALEYVVKEDIDPVVFSGFDFDYVFSGHYHTRQPIGTQSNAMYIGSPLENTRGEGGTEKGFLVYDSILQKVSVVPLVRPCFVTLSQEDIDTKNFENVHGNYVDVVYSVLPKDPDIYRAALQDKHGALGVRLAPLPRKRVSDDAGTRMKVDLGTSDRTLLKRFLAHRGVKGAERKKLLARGLELLEKSGR